MEAKKSHDESVHDRDSNQSPPDQKAMCLSIALWEQWEPMGHTDFRMFLRFVSNTPKLGVFFGKIENC